MFCIYDKEFDVNFCIDYQILFFVLFYQLVEVVFLGQEKNFGVVFFLVRQNEVQYDFGYDEVDFEYFYFIFFAFKYGVQGYWQEQGGLVVQFVVKQFFQG